LANGASGGDQGNQFDVAAFAKEKGLDLNNADALRIIQTPHRNPEHLKADLLEWKLNQLSKQPDASAAPSVLGGGAPPPEKKTDAQILAEMRVVDNPFASDELARRAKKGDGGVAGY